MSRFVTQEGDKFIEEIESMEVCRWLINETCCNEDCICLGYFMDTACNSEEYCEGFEEEDGIIGDD